MIEVIALVSPRKRKPGSSRRRSPLVGMTIGGVNVDRAIRLAGQILLLDLVEDEDLAWLAWRLVWGPCYDSTEELALAVALNFFCQTRLRPELAYASSAAREQSQRWRIAGKVHPVLASRFEDALDLNYTQRACTFVTR